MVIKQPQWIIRSLPHGNPLVARIVILALHTATHFVVVANINGGNTTHHALHPGPVTVVGEGSNLHAVAFGLGEVVLSIIGVNIGLGSGEAIAAVAIVVVRFALLERGISRTRFIQCS